MSPLRTVVQHVVVVHSELLPSRERLEAADTGDITEHRVGHLRQSQSHNISMISSLPAPALPSSLLTSQNSQFG